MAETERRQSELRWIEREPRQPESPIETQLRHLAQRLDRPPDAGPWTKGYQAYFRNGDGLPLLTEVTNVRSRRENRVSSTYQMVLVDGMDGLNCSFVRPDPSVGKAGWVKIAPVCLTPEWFRETYEHAESFTELWQLVSEQTYAPLSDHEEVELERLSRALGGIKLLEFEGSFRTI
jgi:hypothetical protein